LLLIFAFMYIKLDKKGDWKQFFFPLLVYKYQIILYMYIIVDEQNT
jgi:hypothetical protein